MKIDSNNFISLNDFRSVLGNVNDGNVIFNQNKDGLQKVNYGRIFTKAKTESNAVENQKVRQAFYSALTNSIEGQAVSKKCLQDICAKLGITNIDSPGGIQFATTKLERRDIKAAFTMLDSQIESGAGKLIQREIETLDSVDLLDKDVADQISSAVLSPNRSVFNDAESMLSVFGKKEGFNGFNHKDLQKFINNNADRIKLMAFDRLYFEQLDAQSGAYTSDYPPILAIKNSNYQVGLLKSVITSLMATYAKHEEIDIQGYNFIKCSDKISEGTNSSKIEDKVLKQASDVLDFIFPSVDDSVLDNVQNKALLNPAKTMLINVFNKAIGNQNISDPTIRRENALTEIANKDRDVSEFINISQDLLTDMTSHEKFILGKSLRQEVLDNLRYSGNNGEVSSTHIMSAITQAISTFFKEASTENLISTLINKIDTDNCLELTDDKKAEHFSALKKTLVDSDNFNAVQKLVKHNLIYGSSVQTGFADSVECKNLITEITAQLSGKKNYDEEFKQLGYSADSFYAVNQNLRISDEHGEKPMNDAIATIAGKVQFLKTIMGINDPKLTKLLGANRNFSLSKDFNFENIDNLDKWPEADKAKLKEIDNLCANFSSKDVEETLTFINAGFSCDNKELYDFYRDGLFDISKADSKGAQSLSNISIMPSMEIVVGQKLSEINDTLNDEHKLFYNTLVNRFNPLCASDDKFTEFGTEKFNNLGKDGVSNEFEQLTEIISKHATGENGFFASLKDLPKVQVFKLLNQSGISIKDLGTFDGMAKLLLLTTAMNISKQDIGACEFFTRITGLDMKSLQGEQIPQAMNELVSYIHDGGKDPLISTSEKHPVDVGFLQGNVKSEDFNIDSITADKMLKSLQTVSQSSDKVSCNINGLNVAFASDDGKELKIELEIKGKTCPIATNHSVSSLITVLQNKVVTNPKVFSNLINDVLPKLENGTLQGMSVSRARELCTKFLVAKFDVPSVKFATMELKDLISIAKGAIKGTYTKANLPTELSNKYNSVDVVNIQQQHMDATPAQRALVKMETKTNNLTYDQRLATPPTKETVHDCISELIMNLDTSVYDHDISEETNDSQKSAGANQKQKTSSGNRLVNIVTAYAPELHHILNDIDSYIATFPSTVRQGIKDILSQLKDTININKDGEKIKNDEKTLEQFAKIEDKIVSFIDKTMTTMQNSVVTLFDNDKSNSVNNDGPIWKQSLTDLTNVNGLDPKSPNGKFVLDVLKNYFSKAAITEKRAMLSKYLRNSIATIEGNKPPVDPSIGKQVGELMKGAGPIFQKMLQGLPIESFSAETQEALKDMKSRLSPIPESIIKAQLYDLIKNSNGEIKSIEVKKTLGCATVGQAILCHIVTKDHPYTGEDVVIKLCRPNVQTAALREFEVISQIAKESSKGMDVTFKGQFDSILKELDFTLEAENVDTAKGNYDKPVGYSEVRSMGRFSKLPATTGALILDKVEGNTLDSELNDTKKVLDDFKKQFQKQVAISPDSNQVQTLLQTKNLGDIQHVRHNLNSEYSKLNLERSKLQNLLKVWMNKALFGSGFFHGDMHAGNVMINNNEITFIDFGNVTKLTKEEQDSILKLFLTSGYSLDYSNNRSTLGSKFLDQLSSLLSQDAKKVLSSERKALESEITEIFKKSQTDKLASKFFAAIAAVQRHKIALPESVGCFLQSIQRLQGAMSQLDNLMEDCEITAQKFELESNVVTNLNLDRFAEKLPLINQLKDVLVAGGSNIEKGFNESPSKKLSEEVKKLSKISTDTNYDSFGDKYTKLFGEDGHDCSLFREFANTFKDFTFGIGEKLKPIESVGLELKACNEFEELCAKLEKCDSSERDKITAEINNKKNEIRTFYCRIITSLEYSLEDNSEWKNKNLSFEEIVAEIFSDADLSGVGMEEKCAFGHSAILIDKKIENEYDLARKVARNANKTLSKDEQIGSTRQRQLVNIAKEFNYPNGYADTNDLKDGELKEILDVNFKMIRKKLNYGENQKIPTGEIKYLSSLFSNLHQVKDEGGLLQNFYVKAALYEFKSAMEKAKDEADVDKTKFYSSHVDMKERIPMVRAMKKLTESELAGLGLDDDQLQFVKLIRETLIQKPTNVKKS